MSNKVDSIQKKNKKFTAQSLVEMAVMMPILLVLIISALEFGRLFYTRIVVINAAREGAYYLSLNPSDHANTSIVAQAEASSSGIPEIEVISSSKPVGDHISVTVTVLTTVEDLLFLGFLGNVFSITANHGEFTLSSSVEMMAPSVETMVQ